MNRPTKQPDERRGFWGRPLLGRAALVLLVFAASGASCNSRLRAPFAAAGPPAPQVLTAAATAQEIVAAVNQNTARVQTYVSNNASISVPGDLGLPLLRGNLAVERPRRLRLRAGTALTGAEVDLGSNDELYWLWSKRNDPPAVFFARHAEHAGSAAQQLLPIDPEWLLDALGLVVMDPNAAYQGPLPRPDGTLELRTTESTPFGARQRVYVVDQTRGWVIEQHAYDSAGSPIASATASDFRYDPVSQTSLPRRVSLQIPSAGLSLTINTGGGVVNSPIGNAAELFSLPAFEGTPQVDLGRSNALPQAGAGALPPVAQQVAAPQVAAQAVALPGELTPGAPVAVPTAPPAAVVGRLPSGGVPLTR